MTVRMNTRWAIALERLKNSLARALEPSSSASCPTASVWCVKLPRSISSRSKGTNARRAVGPRGRPKSPGPSANVVIVQEYYHYAVGKPSCFPTGHRYSAEEIEEREALSRGEDRPKKPFAVAREVGWRRVLARVLKEEEWGKDSPKRRTRSALAGASIPFKGVAP